NKQRKVLSTRYLTGGSSLGVETVGPKYRAVAGIAYQFGWATGYVILPCIAYLVRDFRILIIPESIRWQLTHGKEKQAIKSLMNAMKVNKLPMDGIDEKINILKQNLRSVSNEILLMNS
ncbi:solute carrier family 22 member 8-like protein, partial [Dinothrombium tinctorium]